MIYYTTYTIYYTIPNYFGIEIMPHGFITTTGFLLNTNWS